MTTITKKEILKREIKKEIYRRSFFEFYKAAVKQLEPTTDWDFNWHIEYLCDRLQKETFRIKNKEKRDKHIIINVPFRSSKTLIVSVCWCVWSWTITKNLNFINLSYSAGLSTDASNKVVELLNNPWFRELYDFEFEDNHRAKTDFKLKGGGGRISSGFLGAVLGRGADIIICDDPNNIKELSEIGIKNTIRTWKDTISTRLNQPEIGLFVVIQQRVHHQDLSGYLLKNFKDDWEHICLPATIENTIKPLHLVMKYEDGLLWPNRFSYKVLAKFKETLGTVTYNNQLMQSASPQEGNIIKTKWLKYITPEDFTQILVENNIVGSIYELLIDTGYGKKDSDHSGMLLIAKIRNDVYIRKAWSENLEFPDLVKRIQELYKLYNIKIVRIEPKASGISTIQQLKRQTSMAVTELPNKKDDKETCLKSVSPLIESGRLIFVEDISNDIVTEQITKFPKYDKDEMTDLVYYALQHLGTGFNYGM